ncbi:MAG: hypothetical protein ACK5TS_14800 [Betaproteobacteria bacterium]
MPRPRLHLIRFHGVLAPNAKLRAWVVPQGPEGQEQASEGALASCGEAEAVQDQARPPRNGGARLLQRDVEGDLTPCPHGAAGALRIIPAVLERPAIEKILPHLAIDPQPPPRGRAREAGQDFPA